MSDNLVLEMLRHIRDQNNAIRADIAEIRADIQELKGRVGALEMQYASVSLRLDRLSGDMEIVKRRLNLVEAP